MLKLTANVDASYNLTPAELMAKVALSDALIVRSATKVRMLRAAWGRSAVPWNERRRASQAPQLRPSRCKPQGQLQQQQEQHGCTAQPPPAAA